MTPAEKYSAWCEASGIDPRTEAPRHTSRSGWALLLLLAAMLTLTGARWLVRGGQREGGTVDLDELERLERDATDEQWLVRRVDETYCIYIEAEDDGPPRYITLAVLGSPANARAIAAARNALPALLRVARAARAVADECDPTTCGSEACDALRAALEAL